MTNLAAEQQAMRLRQKEIEHARSLVCGTASQIDELSTLLKDGSLLRPASSGQRSELRTLLATVNRSIDALAKSRFALAQAAGIPKPHAVRPEESPHAVRPEESPC